MTIEAIKSELQRKPFVRLRLHLINGKKADVPQSEAVWYLPTSLVILKGFHPGSCRISGYEVVAYSYIERIEPRPGSTRRPIKQ